MLCSCYTHTKRGNTRKLWEELYLSITSVVVLVLWMFARVQTHQIVHIKHMAVLCMSIIPQKRHYKNKHKHANKQKTQNTRVNKFNCFPGLGVVENRQTTS